MRLWACLLIALVLVPVLAAQSSSNSTNILWLSYIGDHPVSERWSVHAETQYRFAPNGDLGLFLLRPAVNFRVGKRLSVGGGYAYLHVRRSHDGGDDRISAEHRVYEQARIRHGAGRFTLKHRLRLEHRGFRGERRRETRGRYQLQGELPIGASRYFLVGSEELLMNVGANAQRHALNQNRIYGGIGVRTGAKGVFGAGYLYTYTPTPSGIPDAVTHTVRMFWASRYPFR